MLFLGREEREREELESRRSQSSSFSFFFLFVYRDDQQHEQHEKDEKKKKERASGGDEELRERQQVGGRRKRFFSYFSFVTSGFGAGAAFAAGAERRNGELPAKERDERDVLQRGNDVSDRVACELGDEGADGRSP